MKRISKIFVWVFIILSLLPLFEFFLFQWRNDNRIGLDTTASISFISFPTSSSTGNVVYSLPTEVNSFTDYILNEYSYGSIDSGSVVLHGISKSILLSLAFVTREDSSSIQFVDVFPETDLTYEGDGSFVFPSDFLLTLGASYLIRYNGTDYFCSAREFLVGSESVVFVGNGSAFGLEDTGEPFVVFFSDGMLVLFTYEEITEVVCGIKYIKPALSSTVTGPFLVNMIAVALLLSRTVYIACLLLLIYLIILPVLLVSSAFRRKS